MISDSGGLRTLGDMTLADPGAGPHADVAWSDPGASESMVWSDPGPSESAVRSDPGGRIGTCVS